MNYLCGHFIYPWAQAQGVYESGKSGKSGKCQGNRKGVMEVREMSTKMIKCQGNFSLPFHAFFVKNASGTLTLKMIKDGQSILYLHYMVGMCLLAEIKAQNI